MILNQVEATTYSIPKNFRVISLLNTLGKAIEKIATELISRHVEEKMCSALDNLVSEEKRGFQ